MHIPSRSKLHCEIWSLAVAPTGKPGSNSTLKKLLKATLEAKSLKISVLSVAPLLALLLLCVRSRRREAESRCRGVPGCRGECAAGGWGSQRSAGNPPHLSCAAPPQLPAAEHAPHSMGLGGTAGAAGSRGTAAGARAKSEVCLEQRCQRWYCAGAKSAVSRILKNRTRMEINLAGS